MAAADHSSNGSGARIRLMCSHGGRFLPHGADGSPRYVGGETRVLVVPRAVSFPDLAARLSSEMAGGAEVRAIRHRLADEGVQDVIVTVTCDEELDHMRDEYDRLRATRPAATFRVYVTTTTTTHAASGGGGYRRRRSAAGLPPLPLEMRRSQSEQALAVRAHQERAMRMRRVQSTQEFAGARAIHMQQPSFHHHRCNLQCCSSSSQRRSVCAPSPALPAPQPMCALPYMSNKAAPPWMPAAKATERVFAIRV